MRRDKEHEKNEARTARGDKTYRASKWKCVRKKQYSSYGMITIINSVCKYDHFKLLHPLL